MSLDHAAPHVAGKARIYLNRAPASPTHVAWLVLN